MVPVVPAVVPAVVVSVVVPVVPVVPVAPRVAPVVVLDDSCGFSDDMVDEVDEVAGIIVPSAVDALCFISPPAIMVVNSMPPSDFRGRLWCFL